MKTSRTLFALSAALLLASTGNALAAGDGGKLINLRVSPVPMFIGEFGGDLNIALLKFLSIGAIGVYDNISIAGAGLKGISYGGRVTVHFAGKRISDSWILSPYYVRTGKYDVSQDSLVGGPAFTGSLTDISEYGAVAGYQWVWNNGFNMTVAGGARKTNLPSSVVLSDGAGGTATSDLSTSTGVKFKLDFSLGWAF